MNCFTVRHNTLVLHKNAVPHQIELNFVEHKKDLPLNLIFEDKFWPQIYWKLSITHRDLGPFTYTITIGLWDIQCTIHRILKRINKDKTSQTHHRLGVHSSSCGTRVSENLCFQHPARYHTTTYYHLVSPVAVVKIPYCDVERHRAES